MAASRRLAFNLALRSIAVLLLLPQARAEDFAGKWDPDWLNRPLINTIAVELKFSSFMPTRALSNSEVSILQVALTSGAKEHETVRFAEDSPDLKLVRADSNDLVVIGSPDRLKSFVRKLERDDLIDVTNSAFLVDSTQLPLPPVKIGDLVLFLDDQNFSDQKPELMGNGVTQVYLPDSNTRFIRMPSKTWEAYQRKSALTTRPWPAPMEQEFGELDFNVLNTLLKDIRKNPIRLERNGQEPVVLTDLASVMFAQRLPEFKVPPARFPYRVLSLFEIMSLTGQPTKPVPIPPPVEVAVEVREDSRRIYDPVRRINTKSLSEEFPHAGRVIRIRHFNSIETQKDFFTPSLPLSLNAEHPFIVVCRRINQPRVTTLITLLASAAYIRAHTLDDLKVQFQALMDLPWPEIHSPAIRSFLEGDMTFTERTPRQVIAPDVRAKKFGCLNALTYVRKDSDLTGGYVTIPVGESTP